MTDKQPEALQLADALESLLSFGGDSGAAKAIGQAAALLRTQHAAIEHKDTLLRLALGTLENHNGNYKLTDAEADVVIAVQDAIKQELSQ